MSRPRSIRALILLATVAVMLSVHPSEATRAIQDSTATAGPESLATAPTDALPGADGVFRHGIAYLEPLRYKPGFKHFQWASPSAVKGGTLRITDFGRFDTLNPLNGKGRVPRGVATWGDENYIYDRLLQQTADAPASYYGRLAQAVALSEEKVTFRLRSNARFHDGTPIVAADIKFTFDQIKTNGEATLRMIFRSVDRAEVRGEHEISFVFAADANRLQMAILLSQLYALPRHYWQDRDFSRVLLDPPLGSGPYRIAQVVEGRFLRYERVHDYWGKDLNVNTGRYNFDAITVDYFLDKHVQKESLKADAFDVILEDVAKDWEHTYNVAERERGLLVKDLLFTKRPHGFPVAYMWNLRRPKFQDIRFREALWWLRDFEWANRVMFHDFYTRADSYFTGTDFSHSGTLPSQAELHVLEPIKHLVPPRVFTHRIKMPKSTGYGLPRENLQRADALLTEAGWVLHADGLRYHDKTGELLTLELMHPADNLERVGRPYVAVLERMGFRVSVRTIEPSNYINRLRRRKFDGTIAGIAGTYTPGADIFSTYSSKAAAVDSSNNLMGVSDPAVDHLVSNILAAQNRADLIASTRALDRVLSWNFYGIPGFYAEGLRYVYWDRFQRPAQLGTHRTGFPETWWYDPTKAAAVEEGIRALQQ